MARHRHDARMRADRAPVPSAPSWGAAAPVLPAASTPALPRQERGAHHPSGPLPRLDPPAAGPPGGDRERAPGAQGRHRGDPDTTPLDLAAIALAATGTRTGGLSVPGPDGHRPAPRRPRVLPARAAGALALVGAIAGAGVAAAGGGTMLTAGDTPDTGELARPATGPVAGSGSSGSGSAAADGGRTVWSADFATAGLDRFRDAPTSGPSIGVTDGALDLTAPTLRGGSALEPDLADFSDGDDYHVGFSVRLDEAFPVDGAEGRTITRFAEDGIGSPPLEIGVRDGRFVLRGGDGAFSETLGRAVPGRWTHLALRVRFSAEDGTVSAWQDGRRTLTDVAPPAGTLPPGRSSHLAIGLDPDRPGETPARVSFASYAVGTSLDAVDRDASSR